MLAFCRVILLWRLCDSMSWRQHVVLSSYLRRCCNVSSRGVYCVLFLAGLVWSVPPGGRGHSMHIANNRGTILSNKLSHIIAHLFSHFHNLADPTVPTCSGARSGCCETFKSSSANEGWWIHLYTSTHCLRCIVIKVGWSPVDYVTFKLGNSCYAIY